MSLELAKNLQKINISHEEEILSQRELDALEKELEKQEQMNVEYPFRLALVDTLYVHRHEPASQALLEKKREILKKMCKSMELERDFGYLKDKIPENLTMGHLEELANVEK